MAQNRVEYYAKNRERIIARAKQYQKDHPDKAAAASRKYLLKKRYMGIISLDMFQQMFDAQGGKCAICRTEPLGKHLSVDHDHETLEVRGLLCNNCNLVIGYAKDNTLILENAIRYLNKSLLPKTEVL